jgi:hypothetical protein
LCLDTTPGERERDTHTHTHTPLFAFFCVFLPDQLMKLLHLGKLFSLGGNIPGLLKRISHQANNKLHILLHSWTQANFKLYKLTPPKSKNLKEKKVHCTKGTCSGLALRGSKPPPTKGNLLREDNSNLQMRASSLFPPPPSNLGKSLKIGKMSRVAEHGSCS